VSALGILAAASSTSQVSALACGALYWLGKMERGIEYWWALTCVTDILLTLQFAMQRRWGLTALFAVFAAACAVAWRDHHRKNRGKRKAADVIGEKSRALLAALVRRARESARPSPVLRPAPSGA
jgi:hypothetical protein